MKYQKGDDDLEAFDNEFQNKINSNIYRVSSVFEPHWVYIEKVSDLFNLFNNSNDIKSIALLNNEVIEVEYHSEVRNRTDYFHMIPFNKVSKKEIMDSLREVLPKSPYTIAKHRNTTCTKDFLFDLLLENAEACILNSRQVGM